MNLKTTILPINSMAKRLESAKEESDTAYFYDLMLLGELCCKLIVSALIAGIKHDKDRHRYRLLHKIVRSDGMGDWSTVLDELLIGVPSQLLHTSILQSEHKELTSKCEIGAWQYESVNALVSIFPLVGLEKVDMPKKIQARQWFAYFAQLRNGTKAHGAIKPSECAGACAWLQLSVQILLDNFFLFKREWAFLYQNLNGRYRVSNFGTQDIIHFENLKKDYKYASVYSNGVYVFYDDITLVELLQSDPEGEDFYIPNGNFKENGYEMLSYMSNLRTKGNSSAYLTPAGQLPSSETEGLGELDVQGKCFGNIPPTPGDYIRRIQLEEELNEALLQEDRYPIVTLLGSGGIGKTTLALTVLHDILQKSRFDIILWFSSRDVDLKLEGAKPVKNSILSEQDLADEYFKLMGEKQTNRNDRLNFFSKALNKATQYKTLFVLDNFETVANPVELFKWIDTYVRNPNKVLITSRISKSFRADYPIEVKGMHYQEGMELINRTADNLSITQLLTDQIKEKVFDEAQGHPYVMKILLGQMAKERKFSNVDRIMASQEDILIALFKRTFSSMPPAAKRVFLTLCSWRSVIPVVALEAVFLREDNHERFSVDDTIEELRRSSFIEVVQSDKDQYPFVVVPLAAYLFGRGELEVSPMKMAVYSDKALLQEYGAMQQSDIHTGLKPKIERKFRAVANKIANSGELISVHLPTLEYLCRVFPFAWNYLYQLQIENDNLAEAENALREYLKTTLGVIERRNALEKLAVLNRRAGDFFSEITTLIDIASLQDASLDEVSDIANIINSYLSNDDFHTGQFELDTDVKQSLIHRLSEIFEKKINGGYTSTATDYSRLAWLYMHLHDTKRSRDAVEKGLFKDFQNPHIKKLAIKLGLY